VALLIVKPEEKPQESPIESMDEATAKVFVYLKKYLGYEDARRVFNAGQKIPDLIERHMFYTHAVNEIERRLPETQMHVEGLTEFERYKWEPVGIEEFICSKEFLDKEHAVYPAVMEELIKMNSGDYTEIVLTGGIGSAKTTCALYTNAYQLYLLSCMRSPHREYGLDPSSEVLLIFQSINLHLARTVDFARFKSMIDGSRYFKEKYPFKKDIESKLVFPNRIEVVPVSGAETAAIGQNVIGGLIDELNYMAIIEKSKQSVDKGTFDQATVVYNSIARRRKSRFMEAGALPGILCLVSSKKYPGQFTDLKIAEQEHEIAQTGKSTIYVYDKRVWDVKPAGTFTKGWFNVFSGDMSRKPRILKDDEEVSEADRALVVAVPKEYEKDFGGAGGSGDIINALREIAGVSTLARHPYFLEVEKVDAMFGRHASIFAQESVDFVDTKLRILRNAFYKPHLPRYAHVDLGITGDSAGLAIGCVPDFCDLKATGKGESGYMPNIRYDGILEIRPPRGGEILFSKIRQVLVVLRSMGMNIRWVTYDSFESTDSMQILRQQAFVAGTLSVDVLPCLPYDFFKQAVYDGRVAAPEHPHVRKEILMLERDTKTTKIDHPPGGSKDCADAMAGVAYGLTMRREIWGHFGIPVVMVPSSVTDSPDKLEARNKQLEENMRKQQVDPENPNDIRARRLTGRNIA
jgi:hypothetical protein